MTRADGIAGRRALTRVIEIAIVLSALVALGLGAAALWPVRLTTAIPTDAIRADRGRAYMFALPFATHWPYELPSHPDFALGRDDVKVSENGLRIGTLTPSHDEIRSLGQGRYNDWNGVLWFSSSDGSDPRTNGRSYGVGVKTRMTASGQVALAASLAVLAILGWRRATPVRVGRGASASRAAVAATPVEEASPAKRRAMVSPLTTGWAFALFCAAMLGAFGWCCASRPMPLLFGDDSFTYVYPGILLASGQSAAMQSSRDIGYPVLTAAALWIGSLSAIPPLQLAAVLTGVSFTLAAMYVMLSATALRLCRLSSVPRWALTFATCAAAFAYGLLLVSDDGFVLEIYRAMAEALHLLPSAAALLLFVLGWVARTPQRRLAFMVLSIPAAYLSVMVKPHTSVALALCAAGFVIVALRSRRAFRSPAILSLCLLSAIVVGAVHRFDAWITPNGFDFGPKTLFCNHLDVAEPVFDASTPERSRVLQLMRGILAHPVSGWSLLGFHGDTCMYGAEMNQAMVAAARSEGMEPPAWEQREFIASVEKNPVGYGRAVWKQLAYFLADPISNVDDAGQGKITDDEWQRFLPYADVIHMPKARFDAALSNWFPGAFPRLAALGKSALRAVPASFAVVTIGSTVLALVGLLSRRPGTDTRPEAALLAIAAFTTAIALTTALAHTFDVYRYLTDALPFSLLWWVAGLAYLAHAALLAATADIGSIFRQRTHKSP